MDDFRISELSETPISRENSSTQNDYNHQNDFYNIWNSQIAFQNLLDREKNLFLQAVLRIFQKIELKGLLKVKMTVKIPETFMLNWTGHWKI